MRLLVSCIVLAQPWLTGAFTAPPGSAWTGTRRQEKPSSSRRARVTAQAGGSDVNPGFGGSVPGRVEPVAATATIFDEAAQVPSAPKQSAPRLGVLLLNLGGPEKQEDVEGFLYNLFADPDIIRLPKFISGLQKPLASLLSKRRAPQSREAYESIGGGSPIVRYTSEQAAALETILAERGYSDARCYVAMRYWYPFTEQALDEVRRDNIGALVIVPLYPQFSISTSGSSLRVLQEIFARDLGSWGPDSIMHTVVPAWYDRPGYVGSMAALIRSELAQYSAEEKAQGGLHVLFSAHGVPQSYIAAGDPYQRHIEHCVRLIGDELPEDTSVHLSYQSRVGPVEWLRPYTDDKLQELGAAGVKNLVVVPISFVSEHIETLEEIDIEYREVAEDNGITNWRRCPALNNDEGFIRDLADLVDDALQEPTLSVSAACVLNNCEIEMEPLERRLGLGLTEDAETLNGRAAMMGIFSAYLLELFSGKSLLHFFGG